MAKNKIKLTVGSPDWKKMRKRAINDLYWFNYFVLGHGEVVPMTPRAHQGLCMFASRKTGIPEIDSSRVQLIQIWRGAGKSTLVTKGRTIQQFCQDPDRAVGIANERQDNANAFLGMIKQEFEQNALLRTLFPEIIPDDFRKTDWKADRIVINRSRPNPVNPSVLATGIGGTVTGVHMDEWVIDDIISQDAAENARSGLYTEIEKANRWIVRLQPLLSRPKSDPITFIGTPWWVEDSYEFVEELFGRGELDNVFNWTFRLNGLGAPDQRGELQTIQLIQKGELAIFRHYPIIDGRATWPEGDMTLENLDKQREDDPVFFAAQYLLKPSAGEAADFQESWLKSFEWEGQHQLYFRNAEGKTQFERVADLECVMSVDPAISKKEASGGSAICITGSNGREIFLLEAWTARVNATELAMKVLELYKRYRPSKVVFESVAYQKALAEILVLLNDTNERLPIYEHVTGSETIKNVRIRGLEPYFRKGMIYTHANQDQFFDQYRNFPRSSRRDLLDALSFQRELWERMTTRDNKGGSRIREWREGQREVAQRLRQRYSRQHR